MNKLQFINNILNTELSNIKSKERINVINSVDYTKKPFLCFYTDSGKRSYLHDENDNKNLLKGYNVFTILFCKDSKNTSYSEQIKEIGYYIDEIQLLLEKKIKNNFEYTDESGKALYKLHINNILITDENYLTADDELQEIRILLNGIINYNIIYY